MTPRSAAERLGVPRGAEESQLRSAYRAAALRCHPDKGPGSARDFQRLKEASIFDLSLRA